MSRPKLVIQSHMPLVVGNVYTGLHDPRGIVRREQSFRVIAESAPEEWIDCVVAFGEERTWAEMISVLDDYFYEIETD